VSVHLIGMRDGRVTRELGLLDTNGILRQPWVTPERTSAGLGWDKQYLRPIFLDTERKHLRTSGLFLSELFRSNRR
jgi:hypothetical protein